MFDQLLLIQIGYVIKLFIYLSFTKQQNHQLYCVQKVFIFKNYLLDFQISQQQDKTQYSFIQFNQQHLNQSITSQQINKSINNIQIKQISQTVKQEMRCEKQGHDTILYVCQSPKCDYLPLCKKCKEKHPPQHSSYLIRYQLALQKAQLNLNSQISKLQQYILPIQRKRETMCAVTEQIQALRQEKRRLVKKIQDQIDKEIKTLQETNGGILPEQQKFYDQLKKKLSNLQDMKQNAEREPNTLRTSLTLEIQHYLYTVGKNNPYFTTMRASTFGNNANIAQLYIKTQHEMILSQLELRKEILNAKLLKKMNNESPLYYLIDQKCETSKSLHYFIVSDKGLQLRIYDVERQKWTKHVNQSSFINPPSSQYCTILDPNINRYYMVGGRRYGRPCGDMIWFDVDRNIWGSGKLRRERYSAMVTLVMRRGDRKGGNYLLVAGGFDSEGRSMKGWQLYDPVRNETINEGEMNFASASGTLITFNGNVVFKLGGLSNKSPHELTICPILQKCDFSQFDTTTKLNFTYIELQDISRQGGNNSLSKYQLYYSGQGAIQINPNEMLVYGGRTKDNKQVSETFVINVQKFLVQNYQGKKVQRYRYYARWINEKPLITPMSFQLFKPTIWKNKLYSLQNIPMANDQIYKGLIQFDMKSWYETQNIVDDKI